LIELSRAEVDSKNDSVSLARVRVASETAFLRRKVANHKAIVHAVDSTQQMGNVGDQMTLVKSLPLAAVDPGQYQVIIKIDDKVSKQSLAPTATFTVE
jgi:hypothetical protein